MTKIKLRDKHEDVKYDIRNIKWGLWRFKIQIFYNLFELQMITTLKLEDIIMGQHI